jgi:hypothetical protein
MHQETVKLHEDDSFLGKTPRSFVVVDRRFRGAYCLHHYRPDDGGSIHL